MISSKKKLENIIKNILDQLMKKFRNKKEKLIKVI